jgi:apolipoprotein N-acyltransferase
VALGWLAPSMLWMWDLTAPGYVIAVAVYGTYFGLAAMAVPPGRGRWVALPGAIVVAEWARWTFPFGGVPLSNLAMSQAAAPLGTTARLGNALLVSGLVAVGGVALAAAWARRWRPAAAGGAILLAAVLAAGVAPQGEVVGTFDVAVVQGGGPQRTRASETDEREVFERHLAVSEQIEGPVDVVLWPENVVSVEGRLIDNDEEAELEDLAARLDAPVIAGVTEGITDTDFLNASIVITGDGHVDRYDKVLRVPFGEYVPLRPLVERLASGSGLPRRDAVAGTGAAVVDVPLPDGEVVPMGVVISWEVFFTPRARDAVRNGGEVILNPTNGSSYWLTQVQTQQVASSRLRALETGRWVVQAAPTGFSAVVDADGEVLERSAVSEPRLLRHTVERRTGLTLASRFGQWPALLAGVAAIAAGWARARSGGA